MSKLTAGTYEKYNAKYSTLTLTDGGVRPDRYTGKGRHGNLLHQKR